MHKGYLLVPNKLVRISEAEYVETGCMPALETKFRDRNNRMTEIRDSCWHRTSIATEEYRALCYPTEFFSFPFKKIKRVIKTRECLCYEYKFLSCPRKVSGGQSREAL